MGLANTTRPPHLTRLHGTWAASRNLRHGYPESIRGSQAGIERNRLGAASHHVRNPSFELYTMQSTVRGIPRPLPEARGFDNIYHVVDPPPSVIVFLFPARSPDSTPIRTPYPSDDCLSCGDVFCYKDIKCVEWEPFSFRTTSSVMPPLAWHTRLYVSS